MIRSKKARSGNAKAVARVLKSEKVSMGEAMMSIIVPRFPGRGPVGSAILPRVTPFSAGGSHAPPTVLVLRFLRTRFNNTGVPSARSPRIPLLECAASGPLGRPWPTGGFPNPAMRTVARRLSLLAIFLLVAVAGGCEDSGPRPDILIVTIDTLRADHTSAYGYPVETTPYMDQLARLGVRFENAYAPTATTGPSHAALFTSRHPRSLGVLKNGQRINDKRQHARGNSARTGLPHGRVR